LISCKKQNASEILTVYQQASGFCFTDLLVPIIIGGEPLS